MSTASIRTHAEPAAAGDGTITRLPLLSLIVLATMGFILVAMETMPAGLLPVIAEGLGTGEGTVGLLISAYALGTVVATIPAIALTRGLRRKPLLVMAITGLIIANTVTALAPDAVVALVSRFAAGAFSGTIWGMIAVYGRRISPPDRAGLSLSIVAAGAPVGFAFGTPLGSWLGTTFDWRWSFGGLTLLGLVVLLLVITVVPDPAPSAAPDAAAARLPLTGVVRIPGIAVILAVIATWMIAHNTIYTYISPYLRAGGSGLGVDVTLLVYGVASIGGIALTAAFLDRRPRALLHTSVAVFVLAGAVLAVAPAAPAAVVVAAVLWGVTFGGASAQLQAALTSTAGPDADVANSFLPVAFNVAIFLAGIVGAALLTVTDGLVLPLLMVAFGLAALALTFLGRRTAFRAAP